MILVQVRIEKDMAIQDIIGTSMAVCLYVYLCDHMHVSILMNIRDMY